MQYLFFEESWLRIFKDFNFFSDYRIYIKIKSLNAKNFLDLSFFHSYPANVQILLS